MKAWELVGTVDQIEGHKGCILNGMGWSLCGLGSLGATAVVTYSHDGVNGKLMSLTPNGLKPRYYHGACAHDNRLYVSHGENNFGPSNLRDIQSSLNGMDWETNCDATPFPGRSDHCMASFLGKLVILAGSDGIKGNNDVWSSVDGGKTWVEEKPRTAIWEPRTGALCLVYDNRLWIIGGGGKGGDLNDVWYTENLIDWVCANPNAAFEPREYFEGCVYDDRMWLLGGDHLGTESHVWFSRNGVLWEQSFPIPVGDLYDTLVLPIDNRIFVYGGNNNETGLYRLNMG